MTTRTKSIALFTLSLTLISCDKEPEKKSSKEPQKEAEKTAQQVKKLSPFQQEIQKMLNKKEPNEVILRAFLKGKPKESNAIYLREGIAFYETKHGKKPHKRGIIKAMQTMSLLNVEMRNEESLERIKEKLSDQLNKENSQ